MTARLTLPGSAGPHSGSSARRVFLFPGHRLVAAGVLLATLLKSVDWTAELLWFRSLGYEAVFWWLRLTKLAMFVIGFLPVLLYLLLNLLILTRLTDLGSPGRYRSQPSPAQSWPRQPGTTAAQLHPPRLTPAFIFGSIATAAIFGLVFHGQWDLFLRLIRSQHFGASDPIYGRDIGFYLFILPFLNLIQASLVLLTAIGTLMVGLTYLHTGDIQFSGTTYLTADRKITAHLAANAVLLLAACALGFYLDRFDLLTRSSGAVYGVGYTDIHIILPGLWVCLGATLALIAAFLWVAATGRLRLAVFSLGAYLVILVSGLLVVPWGFQQFTVEPNELKLETPFLRNNIAATRTAYGLDRIAARSYPTEGQLGPDELRQNQATIDNIRIWDHRPLSQTFRQLQQIRTYYAFSDVNVDRYWIDGKYRQIMIAARELSAGLPGKGNGWVNQHLQYTHGYGLTMCLAAEKTDQGGPVFTVADLPPRSRPGLSISRPEIYFGTGMSNYQIVATGVKEFDYPQGDQNVYASYAGHGGVPLDRFWKKALFAVHEFDMSIVLSSYISSESRIQLWRPVRERVARIAPFLQLDRDPYLVVEQGRLFWIQDAYTVADGFPYSEPAEEGFSYIRNSVKIVVDAYDGNVGFFVVDPDDAVLRVYRSALPGLFRPLEEMPPGLRQHLRYPQDMFAIQVDKLNTYHMTVPQVFYNREDVWTPPREKFGGEAIEMQPYYVLMKLPGEDQLQFLLMTPVTPLNRDNMIAWIAGRSDFPGYGEMIVYKLSKDSLILGPLQVEAMIDQDTTISRQLTLWDQRGSRVTRGNLLVIPIDRSFLYVEPVFLLAAGTNIPQLKRVIVSDGDRLAMEPTLAEALGVVFGQRARVSDDTPEPAAAPMSSARDALSRADEALRKGDWNAFGREWDLLKTLLQK
ncbi:MAG: uncharacterized protein QOK29_1823 [Rhodospirillaceae bacterium]|nr:uncharacterized protein [Rhodospirillaceae bacterium]